LEKRLWKNVLLISIGIPAVRHLIYTGISFSLTYFSPSPTRLISNSFSSSALLKGEEEEKEAIGITFRGE
jgi:hypothetical protein